ncbi:MAG: type II toxin-antitoxin system VapC family toxin [Pirellulales bacterium]
MKGPVITDTGPLVALLNRRERHHDWAREQFTLIPPPAITCEAVLSEACFLLRDIEAGVDSVMKLLERGVVATSFTLASEYPVIARLLHRYDSLPMSFADACLVRMSEQHASSTIITLDSDFRVYRKNGRQVIPTSMPE